MPTKRVRMENNWKIINKFTIQQENNNIPIYREYVRKDNEWKLVFEDLEAGPAIIYNYGYVCGGLIGTSDFVPTIDRMEFPLGAAQSTEYITDLATQRGWACGNNCTEYGYIHGGHSGIQYLDSCEKFLFSMSMSHLTTSGSIPIAKRYAGANNSSIHGYVCGGSTGSVRYDDIGRFLFPLESTDVVTTYIHLPRLLNGSSSTNSTLYGYVCGGNVPSGASTATTSIIDRFTFSVESDAQQKGDLNESTFASSANNSSTHSYVLGGVYQLDNIVFDKILKFSFPFDTGNSITINTLNNKRRDSAANNSTHYGYVCGGRMEDGASGISSIERFSYAVDTDPVELVSNLSSNRYALTGIDSTDFISQFVPQ